MTRVLHSYPREAVHWHIVSDGCSWRWVWYHGDEEIRRSEGHYPLPGDAMRHCSMELEAATVRGQDGLVVLT